MRLEELDPRRTLDVEGLGAGPKEKGPGRTSDVERLGTTLEEKSPWRASDVEGLGIPPAKYDQLRSLSGTQDGSVARAASSW